MKSGELIRRLQEADPTGEEHVCVGNADILDVVVDPAYYDGPLQVLNRDAEGQITGAQLRRLGVKIKIRPLSVKDALDDCPDLPVAHDEEHPPPHHVEIVKRWRLAGRGEVTDGGTP